MNLEVFLCYLRLQVESESQLESDKEKLTVHLANPYLFFKLISPRSAPEIDARMLRKFLDSFDFKLLPARTDKLNANFKCVPSRLPATASELMELGIMLFMKQWG